MENTIGKRIAKLRRNKGLTQVQLAERLNISDKAVSKWEASKGDPSVEMLCALSKMFNCSLDYLICGIQPCASEQQNEVKTQSLFEKDTVAQELFEKMFYKTECCNEKIEYIELLDIANIRPLKLDGDTLILTIKTKNAKDFVEKAYKSDFLRLAQDENKDVKDIVFIEKEMLHLYLHDAIKLCIKENTAKAGLLQKKLHISFSTALDLLLCMECISVISKPNSRHIRKVLMSKEEYQNYYNTGAFYLR